MFLRDIYHNLGFTQVVDPATITSDTNSSSIDLQSNESACFAALVGESGDTLSGSVKIELEVQHADDDGTGSPGTFAACANTDLLNSVTGTNAGTFAVIDAAAEDDAVYMTQYIGDKRHVRAVINVTGTHTNGTPIGILALTTPLNQPAN